MGREWVRGGGGGARVAEGGGAGVPPNWPLRLNLLGNHLDVICPQIL